MAWISHGRLPVGFWGQPSSSLIWCEEKYYWSKYIAEPVNTLTNVYMIALSITGIVNAIQQKMPKRFALCYLGGMVIGVGSFCFHATLKYEMQLLDELPMIYTMAIYLYCVCETTPGHGKPRFQILLPAALIALVTFVTVAYIYNGNPVFHQAAYGLMQGLGTLQVMRLLNSKQLKLSKKQKQEIKHQFFVGSAIFVASFAIWNVDNIYCSYLRKLRKQVGYPTAILLEGHGWWHIGTGMGAYMVIAASQRLVMSVKEGSADNFAFMYGLFVHPYVVRVKAYKRSAIAATPQKSKKA